MGINSIKCEGLYAEVGKAKFGKGMESASDFDGTDLLKGAAVLAVIAAGTFTAGCIDEKSIEARMEERSDESGGEPNVPVHLKDEGNGENRIDARLYTYIRLYGDTDIPSDQHNDKLVFYGDQSGAEYTVTFKGLDGTGQIAHYGIRRIDMNTSAVEERDLALANYHSPGTPGEALVQYSELTKNGSTDKVALLDFDGNKDLPGLKLVAYAEILDGNVGIDDVTELASNVIPVQPILVKLRLAEGYLEAPQGGP